MSGSIKTIFCAENHEAWADVVVCCGKGMSTDDKRHDDDCNNGSHEKYKLSCIFKDIHI